MLNVFEPCTLQIGDRNFYTLKESDIVMMRNEWRQIEKESFGGIGEPSKSKIKRMKKTSMVKKAEDADEEYETESADEDCENQVKICFFEIQASKLQYLTSVRLQFFSSFQR